MGELVISMHNDMTAESITAMLNADGEFKPYRSPGVGKAPNG